MEKMIITPQGFERASDKLTAEQLDRPVGEQPADEVEEEAPSESVPETPVETEPEEAVAETEEEKVPKSRFLTMHQRAIEAEKALRQFEAERANSPEPAAQIATDEDLHRFYVETFGEGELTEKLYQNELARLASIEEKAAERAFERFSKMGEEQEKVISARVESFDRAFEELSVLEGKEFSDDEQVALLDIVEEYSPKDKDGKLIGDYLLPLDKAYEIYKVKHTPVVQAKRTERNQVASLQGARSEGASSGSSDADWQPGQDRRWWNKVK
jgi:hypothetical protein